MKKLTILALSALFAVSASAQDTFKQVKKIKDAAEVEQLINANLSSMQNDEKAQCYNHLTKLYKDKLNKVLEVINMNEVAKMQQKQETPYDTVGLYDALYGAIKNGELCAKYDNMENAKGKIAPKFKDLGEDLLPHVGRLTDAAQYYMDNKDDANSYKYLSTFANFASMKLFENGNPAVVAQLKGFVPQIAYFATNFAVQLQKPMEEVEAVAQQAAGDEKYSKMCDALIVSYQTKSLKTEADSLAYAEKVEKRYAEDPSNVQIFQTLANIELSLKRYDQFYAICAQRIESAPNDYMAYYFRGYVKCVEKKFEEALPDFEKADQLKPKDSAVNAMIGTCYAAKAETVENKFPGRIPVNTLKQLKPVWEQSLDYFKKAKEYDVDGTNSHMYKSKISQVEYHLQNDYANL